MRAMDFMAMTDSMTAPKAPTVSSVEAEDELPEITEASVATLSEQVRYSRRSQAML
jgi:hypothetical protein